MLWWNKRREKFILTGRLRVGSGEKMLLALKNECECNGRRRRRRRPWRWKKQLEDRLGSVCATLSDVKESLPLSAGFTQITVDDEGVKVSRSPSQRHEMTTWSLHSISWIIGRLMKSGVNIFTSLFLGNYSEDSAKDEFRRWNWKEDRRLGSTHWKLMAYYCQQEMRPSLRTVAEKIKEHSRERGSTPQENHL